MNVRHGIALLMISTIGVCSPSWGSFLGRQSVALSASVTISTSINPNPLPIVLKVAAASLPPKAFFGKNVLIPVQVTGNRALDPKTVRLDIFYQLLSKDGTVIGESSARVDLVTSLANKNILIGSAIIPRANLTAIQHGGQLRYIFQVSQGANQTLFNAIGAGQATTRDVALSAASPTEITDTVCSPVSPNGSRVSAPDLFEHDGQTSVALAPGVVSGPGQLCIKNEDLTGWPAGPGGNKPVTVYTITLDGTRLAGTAQLVLSYPAEVSGKILETNLDPDSLGIYWLNETAAPRANGSWQPLSRASIDTTLHLVTGMTSHFSTFALFAAGAVSSQDLRPAQRIITPNGDGVNDKAVFGTGIDDVKIFDIRGRRVKTIAGPTPQWDGTNDSGEIVESGVYLYQYFSQGDRTSGVIGVAK